MTSGPDSLTTVASALRLSVPDARAQRAFEDAFARHVPGGDPKAFALFIYTLGAGRLAEALLAAVVRPFGLEGAQFTVLLHLWMVGRPNRLSPTALSRLVVQSPSGMTHTLTRLERAGFVQRVLLDGDNRAKHVQLTAKGATVARRCVEGLAGLTEELFTAVTHGAGEDLPNMVVAARDLIGMLARGTVDG